MKMNLRILVGWIICTVLALAAILLWAATKHTSVDLNILVMVAVRITVAFFALFLVANLVRLMR